MSLARLVASGFGSGYAPKAPGTVGSLVALVIGAGLLTLPVWVLPAAVLAATLGGLWAVARAGAGDDPGWVVIDEFAGQWLAMMALAAPTPLGLLAAFLLFRLLDIVKPGPIGWADRQHGAAGVMGDDMIAGAIAAGILWAVQSRFPGVLG
ncbi:MAG TPA: phosphatidylglycerophosphatase A [Rhizomicrobium sp.]